MSTTPKGPGEGGRDGGAAAGTPGTFLPGARTLRLRVPGIGSVPDVPAGTLTLVRGGDGPLSLAALYFGAQAVPRTSWDFDADEGLLTWRRDVGGVEGTGRLRLSADFARGFGSEAVGGRNLTLLADLPPVTYTCAAALGTGAYVTGTPPALQLHWDVKSPNWTGATWVPSALAFTYQMQQSIIVGQVFYDFWVSFQDLQTKQTWTPPQGTFGCMVDENFVFTMQLSGAAPPPDARDGLPAPAGRIPTVFPYQIGFQLSPTAIDIAGAMLTVVDAQNGTVLGVSGSAPNPSVVGRYAPAVPSAEGGTAPSFAVHDGRLHVAGRPVPESRLDGSRLSWSGLPGDAQASSGLPAEGAIEFTPEGSSFMNPETGISGRRAEEAVTQSPGAAPPDGLRLQTLWTLTPFQNAGSGWVDAVQQAAMADLNQILLYYMKPDLRTTYWNQSQPVLLPDLLRISSMAPPGTSAPEWYESLGVSFLTAALSTWQVAGADQLNATRAQAWLRQQVGASGVFAQQGPALYAREFAIRWPAINDYLADQKAQAAAYAPLIRADASDWLDRVGETVADAASLAASQAAIRNLSAAAADDALYWAYTFFRDATSDGRMAELQMLALGTAAPGDGTAFMRTVQTAATVLSMLDSSNLFSNAYLAAVQSMLLARVVPSVADYGSPQPGLADAISAVLAEIVAEYASSADPSLASIAQEAQALGGRTDLAGLVAAMQAAASTAPAQGGWTVAAPRMAQAVSGTVGTPGANLLCVAMSSLMLGGAAYGVADWRSVVAEAARARASGPGGGGASPGVSPGAIISATKYTVQVVYVMVKWGVILASAVGSYATGWEAFKAMFSTEMLVRANANLQQGFARWLAGNRVIEPESEMFGNLFSEEAAANQSMVVRVFGNNLDEFVGVRLGAVFALASLIAGAIALHESQGTDAEISSGLSVAASALSLLANAGQWLLPAFGYAEIGGYSVASICSVLGALSMVAAAVGVAFTIYLWFEAMKTPTPVQTFAKTYAEPAGFYMPYGSEIDYFTGYANDGEPSRVGLTLQVPGQSTQVLSVAADGSIGAGAPDWGYGTLIFATTDGSGTTRLYSLAGGGGATVLTARDDGTVAFAPPAASGGAAAKAQDWVVTLQADPTLDGKEPASGAFLVRSAASGLCLAWSGGKAVLSGTPQNWTISQAPMAVAGLSMPDIVLYPYSQGQSFAPVLAQPGSTPQTWTIQPALPSFLALDPATGLVYEPPSAPQPLPPTAPSTYTLTVGNGLATISRGFAISVVAPGAASA